MINRVIAKLGRIFSRFIAKNNVQFPKGRKVVSFCFDDFPISAIENGAKLLEAKNLQGTFYAALGKAGDDLIPSQEKMLSVYKRGHELGCHTFRHIDCGKQTPKAILDDCLKNQQIAHEMAGVCMRSFAYPFGNYKPSSKKILGSIYDSVRTVDPGINSNTIDLAALYAVQIDERGGGLQLQTRG